MLLEKAAETVETENRPLHAAFYVKKLLLTALEKKEFQYAISKAKQLIQLYQVILAIISKGYQSDEFDNPWLIKYLYIHRPSVHKGYPGLNTR